MNEKKQILESARIKLKEKFIGIDEIIDKIIDNISLWYIMPELQLRPQIVSLWGITGVGKTDLIRTLVDLLGFNDKFVEVHMGSNNRTYEALIENLIDSSNIDDEGVLLLDEFQQFRTIDEEGKMISQYRYVDIWSLLSDGKFSNFYNKKARLLESLYELEYEYDNEDVKKKDNDDNDNDKEKRNINGYITNSYYAKQIHKLINGVISVQDIMKMSTLEKMELIRNSINDKNINNGKNYNKLLIFISGNIDEAFRMAENVSDVDSDADIYHEQSKKINFLHIKRALTKRFKPEEIARLGNTHIIYPIFNKQNYMDIIKKYTNEIIEKTKKEQNINISFSDNFYKILYNNSVFNFLPLFIFEALKQKINTIDIDMNKSNVFSFINDKRIEKTLILDVDNIKKEKSSEEKNLVLVHELGHALVYSALFNKVPELINIRAVDFSAGFIMTTSTINTKTIIEKEIAVDFGGIVAEEMIFDEENKSNGASSDIDNATKKAAYYVRDYNMSEPVSHIIHANQASSFTNLNYDVDNSNDIIEDLLVKYKNVAKNIIKDNIDLMRELVAYTIANNYKLSLETYKNICKKHNIKIVDNEVESTNYTKKLSEFLNNVPVSEEKK